MAERRKLLVTMLDAVYVDTVDEKAIVAIRLKPAFRSLFEIATTRDLPPKLGPMIMRVLPLSPPLP